MWEKLAWIAKSENLSNQHSSRFRYDNLPDERPLSVSRMQDISIFRGEFKYKPGITRLLPEFRVTR